MTKVIKPKKEPGIGTGYDSSAPMNIAYCGKQGKKRGKKESKKVMKAMRGY